MQRVNLLAGQYLSLDSVLFSCIRRSEPTETHRLGALRKLGENQLSLLGVQMLACKSSAYKVEEIK